MFGILDIVAKRFDEQTQEFMKVQENVRQRAMSGWLDPFQILQPLRASVESATACELPLPKAPRRQGRRNGAATGKTPRGRARPALHFA